MFFVSPLLEKGLNPDWIESAPIDSVIDNWLAIKNANLVDAARSWFIDCEREIENEAKGEKTVTVGGKSVTMKAQSGDFVMNQQRKKKYKGFIP